jgi:mannose-1-phosphate guanylyltransferase
VAMIPGQFQWCDLGSWGALWENLEKDPQGNVLRGDSVALETEDSLVWSQGIPVKVLGIKDLVVVATPQGVLVCTREKSQEVKRLLEDKDL